MHIHDQFRWVGVFGANALNDSFFFLFQRKKNVEEIEIVHTSSHVQTDSFTAIL